MGSYAAIARCAATACEASMGAVCAVDGRCAGDMVLPVELLRLLFAAGDEITIADVQGDPRFKKSTVASKGARFFAGIALRSSQGELDGALVVADSRVRSIEESQIVQLRDLAVVAADLLSIDRDYDAQRNLRLLSRAMDEALDIVVITDSTPPSLGGPFIQYVNTSLLRATGYDGEDLIGKPFGFIMADENEPLAMKTIVQNLEAGRPNEKEILVRRKDGSSFWVEFTGKPLHDGNASSAFWVSVGRDITLRRQTHEQLAALITAIDAVSGHLEIYTLDNGEYHAAFQNREADSDISELVETLLNHPAVRDATGLRGRLESGEIVTVTSDGLQLRPIGKNADTLIAIRQRAS